MHLLLFTALFLQHPGPDANLGYTYLTGPGFATPSFSWKAWEDLYKQWGLKKPPSPEEQQRILWNRYGLAPAPFPNQNIPMGLKKTSFPFTFERVQGIALDCLICHGGSIDGKALIGLGNNSLDLQTFFEDMYRSEGRSKQPSFRFGNSRGTNEAGAISVFLIGFRNPDLTLRSSWKDMGLQDNLFEDVPAWWLLKKKKTMYATGGANAKSARSLMQFMMSPIHGPSHFIKVESEFKNLQAYIYSMNPPKYPFPIDKSLAKNGEGVFENHCSNCHGYYENQWSYPNKIIPLEKIGTDPVRFQGISKEFGRFYNESWFSREKQGWLTDEYKVMETPGYQAPPLDGIWATSPYLHNGSVPTLMALLNSKTRPEIFTRSFENKLADFDQNKVGWKTITGSSEDLKKITDKANYRRWYDTRNKGQSNQGHTFGDKLSEKDVIALLEYLKTL